MTAINKLQPLLQQLAIEEPALKVDVIIQQTTHTADVAARVAELGGTVRRSLVMINALAVTLPAQVLPTVAQLSEVRWISLDGQLYKSNTLTDEDHVTLREEFDDTTVAPPASGWAGLGAWSGQPWQELGENDGASSGDVALTTFFGGALQGLRLQNRERGLLGIVPIAKATAATLTYAYRRKDFDDAADYVTIDLSVDNGLTWTTLEQLSGPATDNKIEVTQLDLTAYVVDGVEALTLRFLTSAAFDMTDRFYVDFVQVEYTPALEPEVAVSVGDNRAFLPLVTHSNETTAATLAREPDILAAESTNLRDLGDGFDSNTFSGSTGWENWSTSWLESEPTTWGGSGPTAGRVQVIGGALRLDNYGNYTNKPSATRGANLGGGVNAAILDLGSYTSPGVDASDVVVIEVSKDGGTSYTTLETFTGITGYSYLTRQYL